jgi:hypothetical protein
MFKEERQTLPIHMLAGMVAGGATRLMVAPLDVLKIRFQVAILFSFNLCLLFGQFFHFFVSSFAVYWKVLATGSSG